MKQSLRLLMVLVALVVPVLAHAAPCTMSMPQTPAALHEVMSEDTHPCPQHMSQVSEKPCDGTMSVADCLDIDMLTADVFASKILKQDVLPVAVLPEHMLQSVILADAFARGPPIIRQPRIAAQPSLILTTGRFRV